MIEFTDRERALVEHIERAAMRLSYDSYIVGGWVRDRLMGRRSPDIDVVCVGDGLRLAQAIVEDMDPRPPLRLFKRFGTAMLRWKGLELEVVGARKESYSPDSRKPSVQAGTLRDDQLRRDFTINALAYGISGPHRDQLVDPFGGVEDIRKRLIVTPTDPDITFSDDPLRMLRAVRFAAQLDFQIEGSTYDALQRNAPRLNIISQERITTELQKIIASPVPSVGFKTLFYTRLLDEFFPEMVELHGVDYIAGRGHKDNFYHTLEVLDNTAGMSENIWLRWAALLHDIAKPATQRYDARQGWTFHGHEVLGARMVPKIFKRFRLPMDEKMRYVQNLVRLHLRPISLTKENITDSAVRRLIYDAGPDIDDLMTLCKADITSKNPQRVRRYLDNYKLVLERIEQVEEGDALRNWQPPIGGEEIMKTFGLQPGPIVGDIKDAIREAILEGDIPNDYEAARAYMIQEAGRLGYHPIDA